jgi:hypothetical protein
MTSSKKKTHLREQIYALRVVTPKGEIVTLLDLLELPGSQLLRMALENYDNRTNQNRRTEPRA